MSSEDSQSQLMHDVNALRARHQLSVARRRALDEMTNNLKRLKIPHPSIGFLWNMCFDGLVLDVAVCWDESRSAKRSFPKLARRLAGANDSDLAKYIGGRGVIEVARRAGQQIDIYNTGIRNNLKSIFILRDQVIAHLDLADHFKLPMIAANDFETVSLKAEESLALLDDIDTGLLGTMGGFEDDGLNLIRALLPPEPGSIRL